MCGRPQTVRRFRKVLASDSKGLTNTFIERAKSNVVILVIDDFNSVQSIARPTSSETSTAIHMATCIIDVHESITSLLLPGRSPHYHPSDDVCKGAVNIRRVLDHFTEFLNRQNGRTWCSFLPRSFQDLNISDIQQTLLDLG